MLRILRFTSVGLMIFALSAGTVAFYYHYQFQLLLTDGDKFSSTHSIAYVKSLIAMEDSIEMRNLFLLLASISLILSVVSVYWRGVAIIKSDVSID